MVVMIDGEEVPVQNDITVVYTGFDPDNPEAELHARLTHEGLILDKFEHGEPAGTAGLMVNDLTEMVH
jgi:hypothetical protein